MQVLWVNESITKKNTVQVDNEVDLSVYLQGRYIPLVGVQRIEGVPVFADTNNNNSKRSYVAYSLAEGEIHGIYNMYIDGAPLIYCR